MRASASSRCASTAATSSMRCWRARPPTRAGLKVGDEIVSVDGAPVSPDPLVPRQGRPARSPSPSAARPRAPTGDAARSTWSSIAPLRAFREATRASARVIEREGRRIGYVHVWASVGDKSARPCTMPWRSWASTIRQAGPERQGPTPLDAAPLDGLIVDMRGKIGGTGSNAGRYLDLLDPRGPLVRSRDKSRTCAGRRSCGTHGGPDRPAYAQHRGAVRPCLQARAAGPADRHPHGRCGQRRQRPLPCRAATCSI